MRRQLCFTTWLGQCTPFSDLGTVQKFYHAKMTSEGITLFGGRHWCGTRAAEPERYHPLTNLETPWNASLKRVSYLWFVHIFSILFIFLSYSTSRHVPRRVSFGRPGVSGSPWKSRDGSPGTFRWSGDLAGGATYLCTSAWCSSASSRCQSLPVTASHFRLWIGNRWKEMEIDRWIGGQRDHITLRLFLFAGKWMSHIVLFRNLDRLIDLPR